MSNNTCPICITDFITNESVINLDCNHKFHIECLKNVKSNSCPLCRCKIIEDETDLCTETHYSYFAAGNFTKKGKCRFCQKKSFKYYLKQKMN